MREQNKCYDRKDRCVTFQPTNQPTHRSRVYRKLYFDNLTMITSCLICLSQWYRKKGASALTSGRAACNTLACAWRGDGPQGQVLRWSTADTVMGNIIITEYHCCQSFQNQHTFLVSIINEIHKSKKSHSARFYINCRKKITWNLQGGNLILGHGVPKRKRSVISLMENAL